MKKNSKGITLIALVVTIIVLLILSMVSINALVGDNGILNQAREGKLLTILSDIMFKIESDVVDINISNIGANRKLTATEMMTELDKKGTITKNSNDNLFSVDGILMQGNIKDARLGSLKLGFNGDIWLDNYKRGKVQLSSQIDVLNSKDTKSKITVIDGTVEEISPNQMYILHALDDRRNEFACWINQYGEIISQYPDTCISLLIPKEDEYIAIYDEDLRNTINKSDNGFLMGLQTFVGDDGPFGYSIEIDSVHCRYSHFFGNYGEDIVTHPGVKNYAMGIVYSPVYEDLLIENLKDETMQVATTNFTSVKNYYNSDLSITDVAEVKKADEMQVGQGTIDLYGPFINDYDNLKYSSFLDVAYMDMTNEIEGMKEKGVTRLYYRGIVNYFGCGITLTDGSVGSYSPWKLSNELHVFYESTIKYIDL